MITGEELAAYAAGEADPAVVARVESALPDDPDLAARLDRLRRVDDLLGELGPITMTSAEESRLQAAVERDLAALAAASDAGGTVGGVAGAAAGGEVVDLASRRTSSGRRAARDWFDPARLAGVAAALVVVIGIGAIVLNGSGLGGSDDAGESADLAAAPGGETATAARTDSMMDLPTATAEALEAETEAVAGDAAEAASEAAGGTDEASLSEIPVVDTQRVVPRAADIDPVALRQRLQPLVELDALEEPAEDAAAELSEPPSSAVGIADGRVVAADREAVVACLPTDAADVIVAEVLVLAPDRPAIAYVLARRVVVVDATTCTTIAQLSG